MRISTSMRWLVVAVSAAMLLAVAAACAGETVEVPGETVVVEKVVTETVEVPGETVVKEVVKEVMVPGETVVVEKVVTETVEVPGETVVVEKEVVKTVEVPGQTVTVEVVKEVQVPGETVVVEKVVTQTVQVPGETVVVEKEVVKTVEVPGETVVVEKEVVKTVEVPGPERVVVKEVPGKKYVTDPTTGKVVTAPEYGGTLTVAYDPGFEVPHADIGVSQPAGQAIGLTLEKMGVGDWALDRDVYNFASWYVPLSVITGRLAESWETPDDTTIVLNIRKGVNWHNKAPMHGRELTASDIEYNFHRILGLGSGYSEPIPHVGTLGATPIESITATDKWTVVFKLTRPDLAALSNILIHNLTFIYPPEVIEEHGDAKDWRKLVGTGPFLWTSWVAGSSYTYTKNADYWGYDEKYPENRLLYIDQVRALFMKEEATRLAALRTAKIDYLGALGGTPMRDVRRIESLKQSNPEIVVTGAAMRSEASFAGSSRKPPFNDIKVRTAMQMALDNETSNATFFKGYADWIPQGLIGMNLAGYNNPFEEWPEEVKKGYRYDPDGAEKLLDEAGYPRGPDGIRFKTPLDLHQCCATGFVQIAAEYWAAIGVDVEIRINDAATYNAMLGAHSQEGMTGAVAGWEADPLTFVGLHHSRKNQIANWGGFQDPVMDAMIEAAEEATTLEEQKRLIKEIDMYLIKIHHVIWGPKLPWFTAVWPWIKGYNGESELDFGDKSIFARLWIDSEMKEALGR